MKAIIFLCIVSVATASYAPVAISSKIINTGTSTQTRSQDAAGNYAFSYNEQHATGGSSRKEAGDAWNNVHGSYSLNVGDGRQRVVKYVADNTGFRAAIATNEPGTAAQSPADVSISAPHYAKTYEAPLAVAAYAPAAYAVPATYAAPAVYGAHGSYAAPAAYAVPTSGYSSAVSHGYDGY